MRSRILLTCALAVFATTGFAKDIYLSIGGSVGVFHTDMRVFNPSQTKDIQIEASLLPVGNVDNTGVVPKTITVAKRQMVVFDDVVTSLFNAGGLAAIRLSSADDFVATQRIYAQQSATSACNISGTLGQFVPGLETSAAMKQGVLIQLKSNAAFRTNIGAVNPNSVAANVTWRLYDRNNALIATGDPKVMPPFGVIAPINMAGGFFFNAANADLSDAWVSYSSDQPILAYASVIDNATTDPTFIPVQPDSGGPPPQTQQPGSKTFNVTEQNFSITISPAIQTSDLNVGDQVTFHITVRDAPHGIQLVDPDGRNAIAPVIFSPGDVVDKTFTITKKGTWTYFCANSSCGTGHDSMTGTFIVGQASEDPRPGY